MSATDRLDPVLAAWLDSGPTALPDVTRRTIAAGVRDTRQRQPRPSLRVGRGAPSRFQALGVAAALVGVTILGVLAATGGPDPSPRDGPTMSSPTPVDRATTGSVAFTSTLYGYTLRHPAEWTAEPATERWTGGSWAELDAATDVLSVGGGRPLLSWVKPFFSAKAIAVPPGTTATSWADANVPRRLEQTLEGGTVCRYGNSYIPMGWPPEWKDTTIGRQPGRIRAACGFVDAVVVVDGQAFVFSMYTRFGANKTEPFEAIANTISFATGKDSGRSFTSNLFGYVVHYPDDWVAVPAARPWAAEPGVAAEDAGDRFLEPSSSTTAFPLVVSIASVAMPAGMTRDEAIDRYLPARYERYDDGLTHCPGDNEASGQPIGTWAERTVAGRAAQVRQSCGFVDGAIFGDGRLWVLTSGQRGDPRRDASERAVAMFDAFAAQLELHPELVSDEAASTTPSELGWVEFRSELYGYSLRHPSDWIAMAAIDPWTGGDWRLGVSVDDMVRRLDAVDLPIPLWFSVRATDVPAGTTAADWATEHVTRRPELEEESTGHRHCRFGMLLGTMFVETGWNDGWSDATVGGEPARLRAACGFVDAVVVTGGRAYIFSSFWKRDGGGDTRPFDAIARTVEFEDGPATGTPFTSDLYGYTARYPAGWTVERATRPWVPGELPSRTPLSDRFEDPDLPVSGIVVASARIPAGMSETAWRDLRLPSPQRCGRGGWLGVTSGWVWTTIDGIDGSERTSCGSIDAVVVVDRRAYVVTVIGSFHYPGATAETRAVYDAFIATLDLRPESAIEPSPSP